MFINKTLPLAALLLTPLAVAAADNTLEEVIVTANPLSDVDSSMSQPVQVMSGKNLQDKAMRNLGATIRNELGVSTSDFGPSSGRPVIRGMSGSRVRVLEDNIGTMDASTVGPDHAITSEPIFAKQIEIFRGPATLLYGSGASGGLINVVDDRIPSELRETPREDLYLDYDSVSSGVTGAGRVNASVDNFAFHADGMYRSTGDYGIPGYASQNPEPGAKKGVLENTDNTTNNVSLGSSYIRDRGTIGMAVSRYASNYGLPPVGDEEGERIDLTQMRYDFQAGLDNPLPGFRHFKTKWGYNDYRHRVIGGDGAVTTHVFNKALEGRAELIHDPVANWNGVIGMQYRYRDFSAAGEEETPKITQDSAAVFILEKGNYGTWHVSAGMRYEMQSAAQSGVTRNHNALSISGGLVWNYQEGYNVALSLTHSQRSPDIEELFGGEPAHSDEGIFIVSNPSLTDETSTNIDLSWHKTAGRATLTANLYYHLVEDFIYLRQSDDNHDGQPDRVSETYDGNPANIFPAGTPGGLYLVYQSQGNAVFKGVEAQTVIKLIDNNRETLKTRLWTDYVRARLHSGQNLPRITPWRYGGDLDYTRGPWNARLQFTRVNRQSDVAPLETPTAGYNMLDLYASRSFGYGGTEMSLFFRGSNLLNEDARSHTSYLKEYAPLPGRSGEVGIRASF